MNTISSQFNLFYPSNQSYWTKFKNKLLHRDPWQQVIKNKSKIEIIDLLTEEFNKQLDGPVLALKGHTFERIQGWNLPLLLTKLGLTEAQITEDCKNEAALVENRKKNFIQVKVQSIFRRIFPESINLFHRLIDTVLMSFGYYQIGRETNGQWEASEILKLYLQILLYPSTIFLVLNNTLSNPVLAIAVTTAVVLTTIIAIIIYVRCIKPCPDKLYGFDNLSTKAKKGLLEPVLEREGELDILMTRLKNQEGSILIGPPGVGKTELVNGLAQRIAKGDVPKELQGKKVFYVNTSDLLGYFTNMQLSEIKARLENYEKDVILFFDEIGYAWNCDDKQLVGGLKTFTKEFPYFICATTDVEYKQYKIGDDKAVARRIKVLNVPIMTQNQVEVVLYNFLEQEAPHVQVDDDVIPHLAKAKKNFAGQDPKSSIEVLKEAVSMLYRDPENKFKNDIIKLEQEVQTIKSSFIRGDSTKAAQIKALSDKLKTLSTTLTEKKKELEQQNEQIRQLKKLRKLWIETKEEIYDTAVKVKNLSSKNKPCKDLKRKWSTGTYLTLPALEKLIKIKSEELFKKYPEIKTKIDITLIDKIILEKNNAALPPVVAPGAPPPAGAVV